MNADRMKSTKKLERHELEEYLVNVVGVEIPLDVPKNKQQSYLDDAIWDIGQRRLNNKVVHHGVQK